METYTDEYDNKFWYDENGNYHREDGPAIEESNGEFTWFWHGKNHRDNGKDVSDNDYWYFNNKDIQ